MKTLLTLTLLFFTLAGWGQDDNFPSSWNISNSTGGVYDGYKYHISKGSEVETLILLYLEYKVECYNDSLPYSHFNSEGWKTNEGKLIYWKEVWSSKQPTFEGFMEFLKSKTEE